MTETLPVGNYRTKLEAEFAAAVLAGAEIPYVIQSMEGLLHGPLGPGATILVRTEDADAARELLASLREEPSGRPARAVRVARLPPGNVSETARARLDAAGVPYLARGTDQVELFVRLEHEPRARRALEGEAHA